MINRESISSDEPLIERIAEEILRRQRAGERLSVEEYCEQYPEHAEELRSFLPTLIAVEGLKPNSNDASGTFGSEIRIEGKRREFIGDYRILREVGRGGMGVVYEAEQRSLCRHVALKVLLRSVAGDDRAAKRFEREACAAARMHHTNIVPVFDVGSDDEHLFYAMQLIQGQAIDRVIDDLKHLRNLRGSSAIKHQDAKAPEPSIARSLVEGEFDQDQLLDKTQDSSPAALAETLDSQSDSNHSAVLPGKRDVSSAEDNRPAYFLSVAKIGHQTAEALAYAHARGIIHRDIKPSNLLLDGNGIVWITDFGLAKTGDHGMTHTGDILGTIRFMSPERFKGQCDVRADVYSLGLTLYELLTLQPAFSAADQLKLIDKIVKTEPASPRSLDPNVPRDLETIVLKCIDKEPRHRYQSADELSEDLKRFIDDQPIKARRISLPERVARWSRRNKSMAAALAVVATLLLVINVAGPIITLRMATLNEQLNSEIQTSDRLNKDLELEAATSRALGDFLFEEIISTADPNLEADREITLQEVLDRAVTRLNDPETQYPPLVEAAIALELGKIYTSLDNDDGRDLKMRAYTLRQSELGEDAPETLEALESMLVAGLYRFEGSVHLATKLYNTRRRIDGDHAPDTLRAHQLLLRAQESQLPMNLGSVINQERLNEIAMESRKVLDQQRLILGDSHSDVIAAMEGLGSFYIRLGKLEQATSLYGEVFKLCERKFGNKHTRTLASKYWVAKTLFDSDRYDELLVLVHSALDAGIEMLGPGHRLNRSLRNIELATYIRQHRFEEAAGVLNLALESWASDDLLTHEMLGLVYALDGERTAFTSICDKMFEKYAQNRGLFASTHIARVALSLPIEDEPEILQRAVELAHHATKRNHDYRWAKTVHGMAEYRLGNFAEAQQWLADAVTQTRDNAPGPQCFLVALAFNAMAEHQLGNTEKSAELLAEAEQQMSLGFGEVFMPSNAMLVRLVVNEAKTLIKTDAKRTRDTDDSQSESSAIEANNSSLHPVQSLKDVDELAVEVVKKRDASRLETLLDQGLSANLRSADGPTLLMVAALHGDAECVRILLDAGADPELKTRNGVTALIWGASDIEKVRLLVERGAELNAKTRAGATALTAAANHTEAADCVAYLVRAGADTSVTLRTGGPLEIAAKCGSLDSVKTLLEACAEQEDLSARLQTAFGLAVSRGHRDVATYLLNWDGPTKLTEETKNLGLQAALRYPDLELAGMLIKSGARVPDLLSATYSDVDDHAGLIAELVQNGADPHEIGFRGYTALNFARLRGHQEMERQLIEAGVPSGRELKQKVIPRRGIRLTEENQTSIVSDAVDRSLHLLFTSSDVFMRSREGCVSCHHQDLPLLAASIARSRGIEVPRESLDRIHDRQLAKWRSRISKGYERRDIGAGVPTVLGYLTWGWSAQEIPPNAVTEMAVWYLAGMQLPDGRWQGHAPRMPLQDGPHQITALTINALRMYPLRGRETELTERIERAKNWLELNPARTQNQQAFRLLGLAWAEADRSMLQAGVEDLLGAQKADGGWSQLVNLESDAWATGLALLAVQAAGVETTHPAYRRGMEFLLNTQFEDGSWFVRTRSNPGQPHFDSHFPFGKDQWISAAGTALATASLALALDPKKMEPTPVTSASEPAKRSGGNRPRLNVEAGVVVDVNRETSIDFTRDIRPLLEQSCVDCHSGPSPEGNFRVVDRDSLIKGGESRVNTFRSGSGADSQLVRHVTDQVEDMEMPPLHERDTYPRLTNEQVKTLIAWIDEGAVWPEGVVLAE